MDIVLSGILDSGFPVIEATIINRENEDIKLKAVIDTGAIGFYLKQGAIDTLKLQSIGVGFQKHPIKGTVESNLYVAQLVIKEFNFGWIEILVLHSNEFPFDFIIGNKFLSDKTFNYVGKEGCFTIF